MVCCVQTETGSDGIMTGADRLESPPEERVPKDEDNGNSENRPSQQPNIEQRREVEEWARDCELET